MDANGLRFWMLANEGDWLTGDGAAYDLSTRRLRLQSRRDVGRSAGPKSAAPPDIGEEARKRLDLTPQARDRFGTGAYWDMGKGVVMAQGALPGTIPIYSPPAGQTVTDLALGYDDVLYLAVNGQIAMQDRRERWEPVLLPSGGFTAWRLAPDPLGGTWALDRDNRRLGHVRGVPLPDRPFAEYSADTFRPCEENSNPPRLTILSQAVCPAEETPAALACSPTGSVVLLTWTAEGSGRVRTLRTDRTFDPPTDLRDAFFPYSLTFVDAQRIAVRTVDLPAEALVYPLDGKNEKDGNGGTAIPVGDFYPLRGAQTGPFLHGLDVPPRYPNNSEAGSALLYPLSLPSYARWGEAANRSDLSLMDSGSAQTVWHRVYLEAILPAGCGATVYLAATSLPAPPDADDTNAWYAHRFGDTPQADTARAALGSSSSDGSETLNGTNRDAVIAQGAWCSQASEIPFHPGLLPCPREQGRIGLFTVLIQRAGRRVRSLRGRYLWVRIALESDGRATPEIAALRAYGPRFSYVERYLPQLYQETAFGPDADVAVDGVTTRTSAADFLERFVDNFEGILTPLEDRIGSAYLLTDPRSTPEEALEWLGSWVGMTFDPAYTTAQRRKMLTAAPRLYAKCGTLGGLALALDIATEGAVWRGQIVLVENYLLRRTFATILGADLETANDPLMGGPIQSGNSYVGDTLILGEEARKEFLALYTAGLPTTAAEQAAIENLYASLAFRLTILIHKDVAQDEWERIRRIAALETPAHVAVDLLKASDALLVGAASLIGVDTYLGTKPTPQPATLDQSVIGEGDVIRHLPGLDPRLEAGTDYELPTELQRPFADAGPPQVVAVGDTITLDASHSTAPPGGKITRYIWTRET